MASFTLTASPTFPPSSSIGIYKRQSFPGGRPTTGVAPGISPEQTYTVGATGFVLIEGLISGVQYVAGAQVSGVWRYIGFMAVEQSGVVVNVTVEGEGGGGGGGGGSGEMVTSSVTGNYTAGAAELETVLADPTAGEITVTLPDATKSAGRQITVANIATNGKLVRIKVTGGGEVVFPGEVGVPEPKVGEGQTASSVTLVPKGANWYVV